MPSTSISQRPRVALIGASGYGGIYLQLIRDALARDAIRLVAAVVINRHEVPAVVSELRRGGAALYDDAETFFAREAGKVDLCLIPVGIQWHARLTVLALNAGMNVLVEKPLAGSSADVAAIRRAEDASGRWVAVGFQDLYSLEALWLKNQLLAGVIGRVEEIRMIGLWPRPRSYFTRNHWAGRAAADGAAVLDSPLNNAFAHFVNLALFFAGPSVDEAAPVEVQEADLFRAHDIEMFDTAVVRGRSPAGVRFWFGVSHVTAETRQPEISVRGSAGHAEWWHEQRCVVTDAQGRRQIFPLPATEETRRIMFAAVVDRVTRPDTFICTTRIAARHTAFVEAVQKAAAIRRFPAASLDIVPDAVSASEVPCVPGLAARLDQAFVAGSALSPAVGEDAVHSVTP